MSIHNNQISAPFHHNDDEISLRDLFKVIFKGKWLIISLTSMAAIIAIIYSLSLPNIYKSQALLTPVESSQGISNALGSYSNLANLAGINLSQSATDSNSSKAIKKLNTLSFFEENLLPNIFLPQLMALDTWSEKSNNLTYDNNVYNSNKKQWVRDFSYPQELIPSPQESFKKFQKDHLIINEDSKSGFITIAIKHKSPYIAKEWVELIVNQINSFYREKEKMEALKAVDYLNKQIVKTNIKEIKEVFASLLQQETQKLTLIEANEFYVFEYIDPPAAMEFKSEPKRALICILFTMFGCMLGTLIVLIRHYAFSN